MVSRKERLQRIWHQYDSRRDHKPSSMKQVAAWAVADGLLQLPEVDPIDILADQMAQAVRETDSEGRRCRVNHAVRATKSGVQHTFWGVMGYAPHDHMEKPFAQRAIVGENCDILPSLKGGASQATHGITSPTLALEGTVRARSRIT